MIIKANRISTIASRRRLCDHVFRGPDNEEIIILQGGEQDVADFWRDARSRESSKAVRAWIVSPYLPITRTQIFRSLDALAAEFGFDAARAVVVEHLKQRATADASDRHWHILVGEIDPASGRVLSSSFDQPRHEYISRLLEAEFEHPFVPGRHDKSVMARLRRDGRAAIADALSTNTAPKPNGALPREAFSFNEHQSAKRCGIDLADVREIVGKAWRTADSASALTAALANSGLSLSPGEKSGEWIVKKDGAFLGSLRRLAKARKAEFQAKMETPNGNQRQRERPADGGPNPIDRGAAASARREHTQGVRGPARKSGQRGELLHDRRDTPAVAFSGGNGNDARLVGSAPLDDAGAHAKPFDSSGDLGRLTAAVALDLYPRALRLAVPMAQSAADALQQAEGQEKRTLASARPEPSRAALDVWTEQEAHEGARFDGIQNRITTLNMQIDSLAMQETGRRASLLRRWFPDQQAIALLERLRAERNKLMLRRVIYSKRHLRAFATKAREEKKLRHAVVQAETEHQSAMDAALTSLSNIARARRILKFWPNTAFGGLNLLLRMGGFIQRAKKHEPEQPPQSLGVKS